MKKFLSTAILTAISVVLPLTASRAATPASQSNDFRATTRLNVNSPLSFAPDSTGGKYVAHSGKYAISIGATDSAVVLTNAKSGNNRMLRFKFESAQTSQLQAQDPLPGVTSYYVGNNPRNWRIGVKNYARLRANEVYPGVDMVYYGNQKQLEFDFVVAPHADPNAISVFFAGMDKLSISPNGDLIAEIDGQPFTFAKPVAYQRFGGENKPVGVEYTLASSNRVQLKIGEYDRNIELVIDPVVTYATYLGGSQKDEVNGIAVDGSGNAFVTGQTCSPDFPLASPAVVKCSAYVSKISKDGSTVISTVVIGGSNNTWSRAIAIDGQGNAYVGGGTNSTDLPVNTRC